MFPGFDGGMEWGGGAADPDGIYYVNVNEMPWLLQMLETRHADGTELGAGERDYMLYCGVCHGLDLKRQQGADFPPLLEIDKRKTRAEIEQMTRQGRGRMPHTTTCLEAKRVAILDYVLSKSASPSKAVENEKKPAPKVDAKTQPPVYALEDFVGVDQEGYPAIKPPWGTLNAVDLNTGEIK